MKRFVFVLASMLAVATLACGTGATRFEKGHMVTGTITSSAEDIDGWKSLTYFTEIFEGIEYFVRLTSTNGTPMGIWSENANDFIVQVNPETPARTVAHTFSEGDFQNMFLRSPATDVPAPFSFIFWIRGS